MRAWLRMAGLEIRALARPRAWWGLMLGAPLAVAAILSLLASQLDQVADAQCARPAAIATAFLPADLSKQIGEARHDAAGTEAPVAPLDHADAVRLRTCLAALADADDADHEQDDDTVAELNKAAPPAADLRARWRHDAIAVLRRHHLAAAVVGLSGSAVRPFRLAVALDDAHPQADTVRSDITTGLDGWHDTTVDARLERQGLDPGVRHVLDDHVIPVAEPEENLARIWGGRLAAGLGLLMLAGMLPLAAQARARLSRSALVGAGGWGGRWLTGAGAALLLGGVWLNAGLLLLDLEAAPWFGPDLDHDAFARLLSGWWPSIALPALALLAGGALMSLATVSAPLRSAACAVAGLAAVLLAGLAGIAGLRPHALVDLVPVVGPLVVMKSAALGPIPWRDAAITTAAHAGYGAALAWLSVRTRLAWSPAWEAGALYAAAVAVFTAVSPLFTDESDPVALCAPLALGVLGVAVAHAFLRRQSPITAWSLRLPAWPWWLIALLAAPALALTGVAVGDLQPDLPAGLTTGAESLDQISAAHWSIALTCLALAPALCEELLFRGALLGLLRQRLPALLAVLVSALMFAALHGSPWRFLPQFAVGIALAVLTLRSGSVLPAILLHATYNGLLWALDQHHATVHDVAWLQALIDTPWLAATCGGAGVLVMLVGDRVWRHPRPSPPLPTGPGT